VLTIDDLVCTVLLSRRDDLTMDDILRCLPRRKRRTLINRDANTLTRIPPPTKAHWWHIVRIVLTTLKVWIVFQWVNVKRMMRRLDESGSDEKIQSWILHDSLHVELSV
jgi:hypothetical protein